MTPTGSDSGADFDRWLHRQLRSALDPELGPRPLPASARYAAASRATGGGRVKPFRFSISAALGAKALVGGAVVALAAGAAAGTATTGSANPAAWGQHISEAVEQCKASDANVGKCISAIAREHGEQMRAQHSEAVENGASPEPGQREGQSSKVNGNGASAAAQSHGQDRDTSSQGNASSRGHGKPSPHP